MMTVVDQHRPWLIPSSRFAKTTQLQEGAKMMRNGTGSPTSQPTTSTPLRPMRSLIQPAKRFARALTMPKLIMKERTAVVEDRPKTRCPSSGTMLRSSPTMPPTKALTMTRSVNGCQFARRPKRTAGAVGFEVVDGCASDGEAIGSCFQVGDVLFGQQEPIDWPSLEQPS